MSLRKISLLFLNLHFAPLLDQNPSPPQRWGFEGKGTRQGEGQTQSGVGPTITTQREGKAREIQRARENPIKSPTIKLPLKPTSRFGKTARLLHFFSAWHKVTSNKLILRIVREGYQLQFSSTPFQTSFSHRIYSSSSLPITQAKLENCYLKGLF